MKEIPNKKNIWSEKVNKGIYDTNFTKQDLEDYLMEIYNQRAERATVIHFIEDENGNSLGRDMFHGFMKQLANSLISKSSFIIKDRGKVFVVELPKAMSKKELEDTYLNKSIAIDYNFYDVIGIETHALAHCLFTVIGLLTKFKDESSINS